MSMKVLTSETFYDIKILTLCAISQWKPWICRWITIKHFKRRRCSILGHVILLKRRQHQRDAIKGNQSEVEHVTFLFFFNLIEVLISRGTFCWKSHLNWTSGSQIKLTEENKRNTFIFWLYLKINGPDIQLTSLDRN